MIWPRGQGGGSITINCLRADGTRHCCYVVPMNRRDAVDRLRALEPELRNRGVRALFLFGSVARDQAAATSDVDLFFDDDPANPMSYLSVIGLERFIQESIDAAVDLIPRDGLHFMLRDEIVASAQQVY